MGARILVVEDEEALTTLLRYNLDAEGYDVETVARGDDADTRLKEYVPDLIVLDWMLPNVSGIEVCRQLKARAETRNVPIIMLSARAEEVDRVRGLETGADDYVVKPFQFEELEARLNALLRRSSGFTQPTIVAGELVLDINRKQAVLEGEPLALTAYEYRILEYLMRHHQQVVAKDRLMEQLYPDDEERDPNVIEVLVGRLRRKLEGANGFKPIDTVRGLGYLFTERCR